MPKDYGFGVRRYRIIPRTRRHAEVPAIPENDLLPIAARDAVHALDADAGHDDRHGAVD